MDELRHCWRSIGRIYRSLVGYELRHLSKSIRERALQLAVGGGNVHRIDRNSEPSFPTKGGGQGSSSPILSDAFDRANVLSAGIRTFTKLATKGVLPGFGGYELTDEFGTKSFPQPNSFIMARQADEAPQGELTKTKAKPVGDNIATKERRKHADVAADGVSPEEEAYLRKAAREAGVIIPDAPADGTPLKERAPLAGEAIAPIPTYRPSLPKNYRPVELNPPSMEASREQSVPASRLARVFHFGKLAFGLGTGAAAELVRRTVGVNGENQYSITPDQSSISQYAASENKRSESPSEGGKSGLSLFVTPSNAERIVGTLCKVRGAALKLGQMLSIQDESTVPSYLLRIFERVRQNADIMPSHQVDQQMRQELGQNWRALFSAFDEKPFAAASIGQVHKAVTLDGQEVAVKVQYPGVAEGIDSDIDNLLLLLSVSRLLPKGMFLDNFATVARKELRAECDYEREAKAMGLFRKLLIDDPDFYVPGVFTELSTRRVLTAEYMHGTPVDLCVNEPQEVRDWISTKYIELCLNEVFKWRVMQTDPNWSNFLFAINPTTGKPQLVLLDFGATRSYSKEFIDKYMRIIRAAHDMDREEILRWSREIGFLTGYESKRMEQTHCESISIIAETLRCRGAYDFSAQNITSRVNSLIPVMLEHRLTAPPEEIYSLHRKLSGSFLIAAKLRARVSCGALFSHISNAYKYGQTPHNDIIL